VVRPKKNESDKVVKVSVSLPSDLVVWMDERVKSMDYATRSHALSVALRDLRNKR
jgi:Arc/MetJ-type ribon-helix-helix transcriptional regulator